MLDNVKQMYIIKSAGVRGVNLRSSVKDGNLYQKDILRPRACFFLFEMVLDPFQPLILICNLIDPDRGEFHPITQSLSAASIYYGF